MWQRQLRDAMHSSQSTPLHQLMMQLSTVVVNCRWIAHRWNLLISSLCRLGAEGWLHVWKVKRLCETWAGMSLPSASPPPRIPTTTTNPIPNPSICIQVIVPSNYQTQTAKGGGEAIRVSSESLPLSFAHTEWRWQWHTSDGFDCKSATRKISARCKCVSSPALLCWGARCELRFESARYSHFQPLPASPSPLLPV